jgi:hypothetical protein
MGGWPKFLVKKLWFLIVNGQDLWDLIATSTKGYGRVFSPYDGHYNFCKVLKIEQLCYFHYHYIITNLMGHDLAIIIVWNLLFIGSYVIDMNIIHLLMLFEHECCANCLNTNVICIFILFRHGCCMSIHVVYAQKSCT